MPFQDEIGEQIKQKIELKTKKQARFQACVWYLIKYFTSVQLILDMFVLKDQMLLFLRHIII